MENLILIGIVEVVVLSVIGWFVYKRAVTAKNDELAGANEQNKELRADLRMVQNKKPYAVAFALSKQHNGQATPAGLIRVVMARSIQEAIGIVTNEVVEKYPGYTTEFTLYTTIDNFNLQKQTGIAVLEKLGSSPDEELIAAHSIIKRSEFGKSPNSHFTKRDTTLFVEGYKYALKKLNDAVGISDDTLIDPQTADEWIKHAIATQKEVSFEFAFDDEEERKQYDDVIPNGIARAGEWLHEVLELPQCKVMFILLEESTTVRIPLKDSFKYGKGK